MNELSPNSLAFIALANEYCQVLETVGERESSQLMSDLLKLLPRLYISATDLEQGPDEGYIAGELDEATYDSVRRVLEQTLGEHDTYLEVVMDDMRYSDTPVAVNLSENLADLYQEFFNLVHSVQDLLPEDQNALLSACREHFADYWGQTLCNALRVLHSLCYDH